MTVVVAVVLWKFNIILDIVDNVRPTTEDGAKDAEI